MIRPRYSTHSDGSRKVSTTHSYSEQQPKFESTSTHKDEASNVTTGHRDGIARFFATHLQEVKELLITVVNDSQ